jgi:hypothetical protein
VFDGEDVKTLQKNFHDAVDEYFAFCKAEGKTADRPFKGSLNIRIPSELHRDLAIVADHEHKSLNSVISELLGGSFRDEYAAAARDYRAVPGTPEKRVGHRRSTPRAAYAAHGKAR